MRQQLCPFPHERHPPPEEVTGGPHRHWRDVSLGQHAAAEEHGDFLGVHFVVFGLTDVDRLHRQRVTEDKRHTILGTQVCKPIPGEETCNTDDEIVALGGESLKQRFWGCGHVAVHERLPSVVHDAEVHGTGMHINAAV